MKLIISNSRDVRYNLAMEEFVLENFKDDDYLMFYINEESLVIGKSQNAYEEVDLKEVEMNKIKVVRRNSGGGTVYHDEGNLNYSFSASYNPENFAGYDTFLSPVIDALNKIGIPAQKRGRSDIVLGELKISGSAQAVKHGRILHHGTLLYDADLLRLRRLLKPDDCGMVSKSIKSVRSGVTNIREYANIQNMDIFKFQKELIDSMNIEGSLEQRILLEDEQQEISRIVRDKYDSWDWNFGASPRFLFSKSGILNLKDICVKLEVDHGILKSWKFSWEDDLEYAVKEALEALIGKRYSFQGFLSELGDEKLTECFF